MEPRPSIERGTLADAATTSQSSSADRSGGFTDMLGPNGLR